MKKLKTLIACILLFSECSFGQQLIVDYPGYTSYFNTNLLIPDSVIWTVTKEHLTGTKIPRTNQFHSSAGRLNLKRDYANSGYDQGHNSPYDDNYYSDSAEYQCFDYVNMFPQRHILNAQTWEHLEDYTRKLALQYDSVKVKVSWTGLIGKMGKDSIGIPWFCIKELWYNGQYEMYVMPNDDTVKLHPFTYYKIK